MQNRGYLYLGKYLGGHKKLKTVCEFNKCAGCMTCIDICPKSAIEIQDSLIAFNAVIDQRKCVGCNECHKVCQFNNRPLQLEPIIWKEGWSSDEKIRKNSSSGGLATAIELGFIKQGGTVCSCCFNNEKFGFDFVNSSENLVKYRGSKYVKSNPIGVYKKVREKIKNGNKVLFLGLPCQVAGVKNYIGKSDNLYTVDLICHGTPSPKILEMYLQEKGVKLDSIDEIGFRTKTDFYLKVDNKKIDSPIVMDSYLMTFLKSTSYTENCYECQYAKMQRVSDLTLGDSWGSELPEYEQKRGISLILIQTEKGKELLDKSEVELHEVDLNQAVKANDQLRHPSMRPEQRKKFFKEIEKGFRRATIKSYPKECIKKMIKIILYNLKLIRGGGNRR